jgi:hypothetical protein
MRIMGEFGAAIRRLRGSTIAIRGALEQRQIVPGGLYPVASSRVAAALIEA